MAASRGRPSGLMVMVFIAGGLLMVGAIQAGNAMLVIITLLRPMRSERCPAMGAAAKPAAWSANMQAPTQKGG